MLRVFFFLAIAFLLIAMPALSIEAQTPTSFSLSWVRGRGAESCLSTRALAQKIEALFGRAMFFSASDAEMSIEASIERQEEARQWYIRIAVSNPDGDILGGRELRIVKDNCDAIIEPITVIIALMMDPEGQSVNLPGNILNGEFDVAEELLEEISSKPEAREKSKSPKKVVTKTRERNGEDQTTAISDRRDQSLTWRPILSLDAVANTGLLPNVGFGVSASSTQIIGELWPIEIRGTFLFENAKTLDTSEGEVGFYGVLATIRACPLRFKSLGQIMLCAGFDTGGIFVTDKNFSVEKREFWVLGGDIQSRLILAISDGIDLNLALALLLLSPRTFQYITASDERADLYQMGPFSGNLEIGIAVQF